LWKKIGQKGVTLIELAVVMTIVGIMALFMAPAIGEWADNYRIRQAARDIASTLQLAKMETISTRTAHVVTFIPEAGTYQITPGGDVKQMPRGVTIDSTNFTDNKIQFNSDGTTSSSNVNDGIYIKNTKNTQYRVIVSPSGNISSREGWT
jgi:prepilin-type N-terminal cleavage/methylation domain-containing protein